MESLEIASFKYVVGKVVVRSADTTDATKLFDHNGSLYDGCVCLCEDTYRVHLNFRVDVGLNALAIMENILGVGSEGNYLSAMSPEGKKQYVYDARKVAEAIKL